MTSPLLRRLARAAFAWLLAGIAPGALHAAALSVALTDAAGKPLADAVALLEPASGKAAVKPMADVEIAQARRQFQPRVTLITTGTRATFPNFDTVRHHVYSFSPIKTFELKLYAGVPNVPVLFDKPGIAVIGCNIHDRMAAWIVVVETPFYGLTGADGRARVNAVAAGSYRLKVWHPGLSNTTDGVASTLVVSANNLDQAVRLNFNDSPLVPLP